jgi:AcrR family transcriptional regulator
MGRSRPGRNGLGREQVAEIQRARMLAAMVEVVSEHGAANVTVAHVVARSGVSRRTFYELFEDREDCLLAALDDAVARVSECVVPAYESGGSWAERLRLALVALLSFLDVERGAGYLLVVESLGAGAAALERRRRVLAQMTTVVDEGRMLARGGEGPPPLTAEGIVGAVFSVIHARLLASPLPAAMRGPCMGPHPPAEGDSLLGLTGPLMAMIVLPYLGTAAARRELSKLVPESAARAARVSGDPLKDLEMRLTYRTLRVLMGLGENPGASNREIGEAAGVGDQGQISKLLRRLDRLGLIENTLNGQGRGGSNAWVLTGKGRELERSVREQAGGMGA